MFAKDLNPEQKEILKSIKSYIPSLRKTGNERKVNILVKSDLSCNMREIVIGDKVYYTGNSWDFHPGCLGMKFNFDGCGNLVEVIKNTLNAINFEVFITNERNWKFNK